MPGRTGAGLAEQAAGRQSGSATGSEIPGLQAALARLLTDEPLLERLGSGDVEEIGRRFQLTDTERGQLAAVPFDGLRRQAQGLRMRRLEWLETMVPVTTAMVTAQRGIDLTVREFCAAYPRRASAEGEDGRERNVEWFTEYVLALPDGDFPPWFRDLARYEAIRARLACGRRAHDAVQADLGEPAGTDDDGLLRAVPRLPASVELAEFGYDVLALLPLVAEMPPDAPPVQEPAHTHVLVQRLRNWRINGYRLGASAYRILGECTGAMTVAALAEQVTAPGQEPHGVRQAVLAAVRHAHRQGFLSLRPADA